MHLTACWLIESLHIDKARHSYTPFASGPNLLRLPVGELIAEVRQHNKLSVCFHAAAENYINKSDAGSQKPEISSTSSAASHPSSFRRRWDFFLWAQILQRFTAYSFHTLLRILEIHFRNFPRVLPAHSRRRPVLVELICFSILALQFYFLLVLSC